MALDCEVAFKQEMQALSGIDEKIKKINDLIKSDTDVSSFQTLFSKIDETNRLLTLLCEKLLGSSR